MFQLAEEAGVSYRTLVKAETEVNARLRHSTLEKIADPLGLHPNQLFVRANLTPYLRPAVLRDPRSPDRRRRRNFLVTYEEYDQLSRYLGFIRVSAIIGSDHSVTAEHS